MITPEVNKDLISELENVAVKDATGLSYLLRGLNLTFGHSDYDTISRVAALIEQRSIALQKICKELSRLKCHGAFLEKKSLEKA